jgi:hypothetical protein
MDGPTGAVESPKSRITLSCFRDKLWAPLCAQCRSPMTITLCEPDFKNSSVVTYAARNAVCWIAREFTSGSPLPKKNSRGVEGFHQGWGRPKPHPSDFADQRDACYGADEALVHAHHLLALNASFRRPFHQLRLLS